MKFPRINFNYVFSSLKEFVKRHDRSRFFSRMYHYNILWFFWSRDRLKRNAKSTVRYDKIPYIIRRRHKNVGMFSYFNYILSGIAYAEEKGYIPVVDMKNYPNTYLFPNEVGRVNSWEYYFEQPGGLSVDDALSSQEYILGRDSVLNGGFGDFIRDKEALSRAREIRRKYIHFKQPVLERVEKTYKKFAGKRVLGVHIRGTDYVSIKLHGHPIQPTAEQTISKTKEVMRDYNFDTVYLATEDKNIVADFQVAFGESLILPDVEYVNYDASKYKVIDEFHVDRENYKYLSGLDYVVSILLLSKCNGLIASPCNGTGSALFLSEGFEYFYMFRLGVY